jgi:hypothetical protein
MAKNDEWIDFDIPGIDLVASFFFISADLFSASCLEIYPLSQAVILAERS